MEEVGPRDTIQRGCIHHPVEDRPSLEGCRRCPELRNESTGWGGRDVNIAFAVMSVVWSPRNMDLDG